VREDSLKNKKKLLALLPDVMDVDTMSKFLGISPKTGYKLLNEGVINYLKIGRFYKIPKVHLIAYLNSCGSSEK